MKKNSRGLYPCPICGKYPEVQEPRKGNFNTQEIRGYLIFCDGPIHSVYVGSFMTFAEAMEEWNRREGI